jgi:hypothetical protein
VAACTGSIGGVSGEEGLGVQRIALVLGRVLTVMLVARITAYWLAFRILPMDVSKAYADIESLSPGFTWRLLARNVHRWSGFVIAVGLPVFVVLISLVGASQRVFAQRRMWIVALTFIVGGLVSQALLFNEPEMIVRGRLALVETPAYLALPGVVLGLAVFHRSEKTNKEPTTSGR